MHDPLQALPDSGVDWQYPHFYSIMRTSIGWIAAGKIAEGSTGIYLSKDGITWSPTPNSFPESGRVSLWQASQNDAKEAVVLALVANENRTWQDIFRSDDGGKTFKALNILVPDKVSTAEAAAEFMVQSVGCMLSALLTAWCKWQTP
jgi:hypothetical protein